MPQQEIRRQVLVLDHSSSVLNELEATLSPWFDVLVTQNPRRMLAMLEVSDNVSAAVVEHVMPTTCGVSILESVRTMRPKARRILMTQYEDLASLVRGLHSGAIEQVLPRPFSRAGLLAAVDPNRSDQGSSGLCKSA